MPNTYKLIISSDRKNVREVEPFIRTVPQCRSLGETKYFNMMIAITEAVNNAIIHGNKSDPSKTVTVTVAAGHSEIIIEIRDQGEGFDPETVRDPRAPENLMREGGRGVFLISSLTDHCAFRREPDGMCAVLTIRL